MLDTEFKPTDDRDVRFTPLQIAVTQRALRDEIKKRNRSIEKALQNKRAGQKIQENVLDSHYREREAAQQALDNLEAARRQIANKIREKLGLGPRSD